MIGGFLVSIVFGGLFSDSFGGLSNSEHEEMLKMTSQLEKVTAQSRQQELYLEQLRKVLKGDVSSDSLKIIPEGQLVDPRSIDTSRTIAEQQLAQKVGKELGSTTALYRIKTPIREVTVLDKYHSAKHPYIRIKAAVRTPVFAFAEGIVLIGRQTKSSGIVLSFEGGIVVTFKNVGEVEATEGSRTKVGQILAYTIPNQAVTIEIRKGETPINPSEVFDFETVPK